MINLTYGDDRRGGLTALVRDRVIDRRAFIIGTAGAFLTASLGVKAQQTRKVPRIAYVLLNSADTSSHLLVAFREGMRERGWIIGENVELELRSAEGKGDRLEALVSDLIRANVDVIVTTSSQTTWAAKAVTSSIPIVMAASADAVGEGLVDSLAHPGGNITGMTFLTEPQIAGKQLQFLHEMTPAASRVGVLLNPTNKSHAAFLRELKASARSFSVQLQIQEASNADQLDRAFRAMATEHAEALLVLTDSLFLGQRLRIVELAARTKLPGLYSQKEFVEEGGLASYGPSLTDMYRRAATHVDKILRGAKPGDLPVEQPTELEFWINSKTAKTQRIDISPSLRMLAKDIR